MAAVVLVSCPVSAIEWIDASGAGAAGAACVDGIGSSDVPDARGVHAFLLAYAAARSWRNPTSYPARRRWGWLPRFGNQAQTAIGQFSVRTLARSRQHRLILGFYLGIGLAFTCLLLKGSDIAMGDSVRDESMLAWSASILVWSASILVMVLAALGTRVAFALPLDLRANWIFRVIGVRGGLQTVAANRRALLLLSVAPVWLLTAVVCFAALAWTAERGTPRGSWTPWHDPGRSMSAAFSENPLHLFLAARQIALSHGFSRCVGCVDGRPESRPDRTAIVAGDRQHDGDAGAVGRRMGLRQADDDDTGEAGRTGTAVRG